MASAEQRLADALRDRVHLLRIAGFEPISGRHDGHRYCAWVQLAAGMCSAVIITVADQDAVACQIRTKDIPADLLAVDLDRQEWRATGSFLRCSDRLLVRIAAEPGTFTPADRQVVDRPPYH